MHNSTEFPVYSFLKPSSMLTKYTRLHRRIMKFKPLIATNLIAIGVVVLVCMIISYVGKEKKGPP